MNIVFLGTPGSGKGTQSVLIEKNYGFKKLSTGDMLRKAVADKTPLGLKAKELIEAGILVPDEIMVSMINETIKSSECTKGVILDGFPRTLTQAQELDKMLANIGQRVDIVLELKVDDNDIIDRLSGRFSCAQCGTGYNDKFMKPQKAGICDKCGSHEFNFREDDKAETIANRLKIYHTQMEKLLPYYQNKGVLCTINGSADVEEVYKEIDLIIKSKANILT